MFQTRKISSVVERELWGRAAGRCQFGGCNRLLYRSPITQETVNISEKAHIYSFSKNGPRGQGKLAGNTAALNEIENLILVCHDCHRTIDQHDDGDRYSVDVVRQFKADHERRIAFVSGIDADKKSAVILYGANIGDEASPLRAMQAYNAMTYLFIVGRLLCSRPYSCLSVIEISCLRTAPIVNPSPSSLPPLRPNPTMVRQT